MTDTQKIDAIRALIAGEYDNPNLLLIGELSCNKLADIAFIVLQAPPSNLTRTERT